MRKLFLIGLLVPMLGISQTKNVVNVFRIFAKPEMNTRLEKAIAAHAQKYHKGKWAWRVMEIQSGPDAGGFQINEGPLTWDDFDKRGNLGVEHTADWDRTVAPLLTDKGSTKYVTYQADLSTVQLTDYSDKVVINHMFAKPGMVNGVKELVVKLKKVWEAGNETVAVYNSANSGSAETITSTRLKQGLKELDDTFRKPIAERFDAVHGAGSWDAYLGDYAKYVESRFSEILAFRADLSSK